MAILVLGITSAGYATQNQILTGADQSDLYLNKLKGKNLALVVNQTSRIADQHLVDFLLGKKLTIKRRNRIALTQIHLGLLSHPRKVTSIHWR